MKGASTIHRFIAFAMLVLFTFSIAPKRYLHDLVADHRDTYSFYPSDETSVHQAGINCHCEDLVVSTPFVEVALLTTLSPSVIYQEPAVSSFHFYFFTTRSTKDSRGPPAVA